MTLFDDREDAFERKFAHDEATKFKVEARRNKLLGLWAASILGKSGEAAESYAKEVIKADFDEPGDEDVYRKLAADLKDRATEDAIRSKMQEMLAAAKVQILSETE
ncbi:MAG: DUF1476 domain-containing protein [Aestuariivita sp.]|nr:DUF1476 domain-containing protein [Aestuariivita sp.]MCY4201098.1 DUF1476 domain-containing protein [Aestuariivita sp.]MCY4288285.1 DUF1476 domain-containing protein [Aestuariivita sp.]MCY4345929.1 DUF1476 domain-containing protein [Aestuariivita sp.]